MPVHTTHQYDASSGLSWSETVLKAPPRRTSYFRLPARAASRPPSATPGAPSLEELSIRSLLAHLDYVTVDTLVGLPLHLGAALWARIERLNLTTPLVFSAFCRAFPNEPSFLYYRAAEIVPQRPFPEYLDLLASPDGHWLTALTISGVALSRPDLIAISSLPNIVALDIYSSGSFTSLVDDRLIWTWALHAETGRLSQLQVLVLRNQPDVSSAALGHLSAFPSLALFGVKGCGISSRDEVEAGKAGWTTADEHGVLEAVRRDVELSRTWDGALYGMCRRSAGMVGAVGGRGQEEDQQLESSRNGEDDRQVHSTTTNITASSLHPSPANTHPSPPPILSYRLGHTSPDVLGLSTFSPLVFFRCLRHTPSSPREPEPTRAARSIWPGREDKINNTGGAARKRRVRTGKGRGVGELLQGFGVEVGANGNAVAGRMSEAEGARRESRSH